MFVKKKWQIGKKQMEKGVSRFIYSAKFFPSTLRGLYSLNIQPNSSPPPPPSVGPTPQTWLYHLLFWYNHWNLQNGKTLEVIWNKLSKKKPFHPHGSPIIVSVSLKTHVQCVSIETHTRYNEINSVRKKTSFNALL